MSAAVASVPVPPLRRPRRNERLPASLGLSLAMHLLLVAALAVAVRWNVEPQGSAVVELWGPLAGAEKAAATPEPEAAAPPPQPAPPPVQAQPEPVRPQVDIALEQEKKRREAESRRQAQEEARRKEERERIEADKRRAAEEDQRKQAAADAEKKRQAAQREQEQRLAAQSAELRKQIEARTQAQAGGSGAPGPVAALGRGSADAGYAAQVIACIRPHIVYAVPDNIKPGQYRAEFVVHLLPSGEQVGSPRLDRSSGLAGFDGAVGRALRRCDPFPRKKDGTVDRTVTVVVDPVDAR